MIQFLDNLCPLILTHITVTTEFIAMVKCTILDDFNIFSIILNSALSPYRGQEKHMMHFLNKFVLNMLKLWNIFYHLNENVIK